MRTVRLAGMVCGNPYILYAQYFPLKEPMRVPPGATLDCNIWRKSDEGRVWYEWCAEVLHGDDGMGEKMLWAASPIHNPGGRSYHVKK